MKRIYHIYFDCSGSVLIGEETTSSSTEISLTTVRFVDANGNEHPLKDCQVNRNKIAFYYVERKLEDE